MKYKTAALAVISSLTMSAAIAGTFSVQQTYAPTRSSSAPAQQSQPQQEEDSVDGLIMVSGSGRSIESKSTFGVVNKGIRPKRIETVSEQRHSRRQKTQTMKDAISYVVPEDFDVFSSDRNILAVETGFISSTSRWDEALSDLFYGNDQVADVKVTIDWDKKQIIMRRDRKDVKTAAIIAAEQAPIKRYTISINDGFLSKTLARWCKESEGCKQVRWDANAEIVVEADVSDMGSTLQDAVSNVFSSLETSITDQRFRYRISPNGVLIVTN